MSRRLGLVFGILLVGLQGAMAQPAPAPALPEPDWEVENRYPLFRRAEDFRKILGVYNGLSEEDRKASPALALEKKLQELASQRKLSFRSEGSVGGSADRVESFGWAWPLSRPETNCYQPSNQGFHPCTVDAESFMSPTRTAILVRPPRSLTLPAGKLCRFRITGAFNTIESAETPCDKIAEIRFGRVPLDTDFSLALVAREPARRGQVRARQASEQNLAISWGQKARNFFVAGLGDSFASGEGNPDRPAAFSDTTQGLDYNRSSKVPGFGGVRYYPLRYGHQGYQFGGANGAVWSNPQCHRSLYSQHVRSTLALALEQKHAAIRFTAYACTGAEILSGILGPQAARHNDIRREWRDDVPQIVKLLRDYCSRAEQGKYAPATGTKQMSEGYAACQNWRIRPPDAVLLSVGGNDIGFARVVAGLTMNPDAAAHPGGGTIGDFLRVKSYELWRSFAKPLSIEDALAWIDKPRNSEDFKPSLATKFQALSRELARLLAGPDGKQPPIIQTGYPYLTGDPANPACKPSDKGAVVPGMQVHSLLSLGENIKNAGNVPSTLNKKLAGFVGAYSGGLDWTFLSEHAAKFIPHGLCATDARDDPGLFKTIVRDGIEYVAEDRGRQRLREGTQILTNCGRIPFPFSPKTWDGSAGSDAWQCLWPSGWRAYRERQRWFVTPNDAFLTAHYLNTQFPAGDPTQPLVAATYSGAFHPNALGHAATADTVLPKLREKLGLLSTRPSQ